MVELGLREAVAEGEDDAEGDGQSRPMVVITMLSNAA